MRAKSRQRKRHRLNVVLIKNDSLSKIFFGSYFFNRFSFQGAPQGTEGLSMAGNIIRTGIVVLVKSCTRLLVLRAFLPNNLYICYFLFSANGQMVMASTGQRIVQQPGGQQVGPRACLLVIELMVKIKYFYT